jgi:glycosyltransferase involved in cell wall biosynthesis
MNISASSLHISLIICTYNNASLLDRTLTTLSKQQVPPYVKWMCLVVDNNCIDDTLAIVNRHIRSGAIPHLRIVSEPIQGLTPARLCGVKNTTGDWIAFVDDDCLLQEDWIAQAAMFASEHPNCGAFGGQVVLDWERPPPAFVLRYGYSFAEQNHGSVQKKVPFLVGAGLVINRSALLATGWVNKPLLSDRIGKRLVSGGDVEIVLRIRSAGYELWYAPECKLMHFIPSKRTSTDFSTLG